MASREALVQSGLQQRGQGSTPPQGSAEFVCTQIGGSGLSCPHFPRYRVRNFSNPPYPSRLGFFHAASAEPRISYIQTAKLCVKCLNLAVPDGYNFWSMIASASGENHPDGKHDSQGSKTQEEGWLKAAPSADRYPPLYEAGAETFSPGSQRPNALPSHIQREPMSVPIPLVLGAGDAWGWLQEQRKPFYIDQLHLTKEWSVTVERTAETDAKIAHQTGTPFVPTQPSRERPKSHGPGTKALVVEQPPDDRPVEIPKGSIAHQTTYLPREADHKTRRLTPSATMPPIERESRPETGLQEKSRRVLELIDETNQTRRYSQPDLPTTCTTENPGEGFGPFPESNATGTALEAAIPGVSSKSRNEGNENVEPRSIKTSAVTEPPKPERPPYPVPPTSLSLRRKPVPAKESKEAKTPQVGGHPGTASSPRINLAEAVTGSGSDAISITKRRASSMQMDPELPSAKPTKPRIAIKPEMSTGSLPPTLSISSKPQRKLQKLSHGLPHTTSWCRHEPLPFDGPAPVPPLSLYLRQAETLEPSQLSALHSQIEQLVGPSNLLEGRILVSGPGYPGVDHSPPISETSRLKKPGVSKRTGATPKPNKQRSAGPSTTREKKKGPGAITEPNVDGEDRDYAAKGKRTMPGVKTPEPHLYSPDLTFVMAPRIPEKKTDVPRKAGTERPTVFPATGKKKEKETPDTTKSKLGNQRHAPGGTRTLPKDKGAKPRSRPPGSSKPRKPKIRSEKAIKPPSGKRGGSISHGNGGKRADASSRTQPKSTFSGSSHGPPVSLTMQDNIIILQSEAAQAEGETAIHENEAHDINVPHPPEPSLSSPPHTSVSSTWSSRTSSPGPPTHPMEDPQIEQPPSQCRLSPTPQDHSAAHPTAPGSVSSTWSSPVSSPGPLAHPVQGPLVQKPISSRGGSPAPLTNPTEDSQVWEPVSLLDPTPSQVDPPAQEPALPLGPPTPPQSDPPVQEPASSLPPPSSSPQDSPRAQQHWSSSELTHSSLPGPPVFSSGAPGFPSEDNTLGRQAGDSAAAAPVEPLSFDPASLFSSTIRQSASATPVEHYPHSPEHQSHSNPTASPNRETPMPGTSDSHDTRHLDNPPDPLPTLPTRIQDISHPDNQPSIPWHGGPEPTQPHPNPSAGTDTPQDNKPPYPSASSLRGEEISAWGSPERPGPTLLPRGDRSHESRPPLPTQVASLSSPDASPNHRPSHPSWNTHPSLFSAGVIGAGAAVLTVFNNDEASPTYDTAPTGAAEDLGAEPPTPSPTGSCGALEEFTSDGRTDAETFLGDGGGFHGGSPSTLHGWPTLDTPTSHGAPPASDFTPPVHIAPIYDSDASSSAWDVGSEYQDEARNHISYDDEGDSYQVDANHEQEDEGDNMYDI